MLVQILLASLVLLSGCVSMQAVKDYSTYSRATFQSVIPLAKDFHGSCLRANSYKPFDLSSKCESELRASDSILLIVSVLDAYGAALGELASDELVDYVNDVTKLTDELKKLGSIDVKKIDAVGNLSSALANAATGAYRQREIVKLVTASDEAVFDVVEVLAELVEKHYAQAISIELTAWAASYMRVELIERLSKPLEWEAFAKGQWQQRADLQAKLSATARLALSIRAIGQTHRKLKRDADRITSKEVYASVRSFVEAAKPVIKDLQEAFARK